MKKDVLKVLDDKIARLEGLADQKPWAGWSGWATLNVIYEIKKRAEGL